MAKLLAELDRVGADAPGQRTARFRTVALVAYPDGDEVWADGEVTGVIARAAIGDAGFGYDPVFVPDGFDGRTFAQMSAEEKHGISHRGRAFRALAERLRHPRPHEPTVAPLRRGESGRSNLRTVLVERGPHVDH